MTKQNNTHRRSLEKIAQNPSKFGFKRIIYVAIEPRLFDKSRRLVAEPDLILKSSEGDVFIVEYKSNGDVTLLERAEEQVARASGWYGRYEDVDLDRIHTKIISGKDPKYRGLF